MAVLSVEPGLVSADGVIDRATTRGGQVVMGPMELRPGVALVVIVDPDGNTFEVIQES